VKSIPKSLAIQMVARGTWSFLTSRPLCVSYELTHSCTADCKHCDKGGIKPGPLGALSAEDYGHLQKKLKPMSVQISGGEPMLRKDLEEIVQAIKEPGGLPYLILVSNARLMTEEKYLRLRSLGVNQFSISLDFPDERHDDFRRSPGLYAHLAKLLPKLARHGGDDIVMNTAITRDNMHVLKANYERAKEWGVNISYSAYTPLRTGNRAHYIESAEDLQILKRNLNELLELKSHNGHITNSSWTLSGTYEYFRNGTIPGCKAGERFLVVSPDGTMRPCSMFNLKYSSLKEIKKEFIEKNTCGECYVSIRAYLDASYSRLLMDNVRNRVFSRNSARA
jgi:MoaA/NifB/PqqE/SkfB family radical SAM enzyme